MAPAFAALTAWTNLSCYNRLVGVVGMKNIYGPCFFFDMIQFLSEIDLIYVYVDVMKERVS